MKKYIAPMLGPVFKYYGIKDPTKFLERLRRFGMDSPVNEPIELLRAGAGFHMRGLINSKAIQNNLDWVWPYWVVKQFDPTDPAFIPRAFSFSHINLTHRNWTAIGLPGFPYYPIVGPRGLLTPFFDSWSIDTWIINKDSDYHLFPSKEKKASQRLNYEQELSVTTKIGTDEQQINLEASVIKKEGNPTCVLQIKALASSSAWLAISFRPFNPEGISFIDTIDYDASKQMVCVNKKENVFFSTKPETFVPSNYTQGDVASKLQSVSFETGNKVICKTGMANAAALFPIPDEGINISLFIPLLEEPRQASRLKINRKNSPTPFHSWEKELENAAQIKLHHKHFGKIFQSSLHTVCLLSPDEIYPGPFTYKRFWYRDAALILHGLIKVNLLTKAKEAIELLLSGLSKTGYFHSQEGEWDSNGQMLWIIHLYIQFSGDTLPIHWQKPIKQAAHWILNKRVESNGDVRHAGLLPAGFSAEHFGPNDHYYWDVFWSHAGLLCAAQLMETNDQASAERFKQEAEKLMNAIDRSWELSVQANPGMRGFPASPYRRMDAGAIGSIVVDYPLQQLPPQEKRVAATIEFLLEKCSVNNGFFQDMVHSGINAYLTIHIAQVLLRAEDPRALQLVESVADLASPTGMWPEAIHPKTLGGCMGDGQHAWAAAEWLVMMRHLFVREEGEDLIIGAGLSHEWVLKEKQLRFGPTPTPYGTITVTLNAHSEETKVSIEGSWRKEPKRLCVSVKGYEILVLSANDNLLNQPLTPTKEPLK